MKNLLFHWLVFFIPAVSLGQARITGKIMTEDGRPVSAVNVFLLNSRDSSLKKGCMSNDSGVYVLDRIDPGVYMLSYTAIGYQSSHSGAFELASSAGTKSMAIQIMLSGTRQLQEVVVQAEKPLYQHQIEGTTVNVESSILSKGSTVLQVLERSPGVYLDHHHNTINLNGKDGVVVMIDGKVLQMPLGQVLNLLSSMSADNIEKIELLTTPPAKYDAEGNAGIINIVLKKSRKQGTNGSFSLTGGYGWREKAAGAINIDHHSNGLDLYGSYSYSHDRFYQDWFSNGSENVAALGGQTSFNFWSNIRPVENSQNASLGFSKRITPTWTIGSSVNYNYTSVSIRTFNLGQYTIQPDSFLQLNANIDQHSGSKNLLSSFFLEKEIRDGEKINADVDYLRYTNNTPIGVHSSLADKGGNEVANPDSLFSPYLNGFSNTAIDVWVGRLDYQKRLGKKVKLEAGGKGTYTTSTGLSGIESLINGQWANISGNSNNIIMKENIDAVYASATAQIDASTSLVAGLRYEYSQTRVDDPVKGQRIVDRKLGELFPSIFFSRKLTDKSDLQLSYSKRINRPSFTDLASYVTYNDPLSVFTGNPLLRPTITNNLKLGYNYQGYSLSILAGRDEYPIAGYQVVANPAGNLAYICPENLSYQNNLTFEIKAPLKIGSWWTMNYSLVGGWRQFKLDYAIEPVEKTYFGYSVNFTETFKLPNRYSAELSGFYNSLAYNGANRVEGFGTVNAGLKKELKGNGGSFQLSVADIFQTMYINSSLGDVSKEAFSLKSHIKFNTESTQFPIIKLTYARSFGDNDLKGRGKHDSGSEDERKRIK